MIPVLDPDSMRRADQAGISVLGHSSLQLMENAAHSSVDIIRNLLHPDDHVLVRERGDLLGREALHLDVVVEQRVVVGELLDLPVADTVAAAVADVREVHAVLDGEGAHDRGAHAPLLGVALGGLVDPEVGELDRRDQAVLLVAARAVHLVRPRALRVLGRGREELAHRVHGHLGRDLAGRVPAHAVGHDVEAILAEDREAVLVVISLATDVRLAGGFHAERRRHGGSFRGERRCGASREGARVDPCVSIRLRPPERGATRAV